MTLTVSQINNYIRGIFDFDSTLDDVTVCGEVTNVKAYSKGWYFSLKDEQSAINCFCYAGAEPPVAGQMAVAYGKVNYLTKNGSVSFFVRRLTVTRNLGAQYQLFVQLRDKLAKEGLFDEARKKPVPHCCARVGVVTSPTGAVIHDITNVCLRRQPFTEIVLYPVKVQGAGADKEICQGIDYFATSDVDVVIVGRGGGSNEDLSVFNSEDIVRAVAACGKPVVSAVGHGVDFTLCDFVADKRAVTPSEAAEFVTLDVAETKLRVNMLLGKLQTAVADKIDDYRHRTTDGLRRLQLDAKRKVERKKADIEYMLKHSADLLNTRLVQRKTSFDKSVARLSAANPTNLLKRGYAYASKDGNNVSRVADVTIGDKLQLTVSDGSMDVTVDSVTSKGN